MKVKILLSSFLICVFTESCQKEKDFLPPLNQQEESTLSPGNIDIAASDPVSNKADTIFSDIGAYAQLDTNSYWKYENLVIIHSDYPPFKNDTIVKTFQERFVGDTIYDYKQFHIKNDNILYHYSNGEYYKIDCNKDNRCFYYKYLDENLATGSIWLSDTIKLPGEIFAYKEINIVAKNLSYEVCGVTYDEVIEVREAHIHQNPENFDGVPMLGHFITYHYAKDFGLVRKEVKIPDNISNVTCLVEFGRD